MTISLTLVLVACAASTSLGACIGFFACALSVSAKKADTLDESAQYWVKIVDHNPRVYNDH